jgi:N-acyl-L-homoserine lactone synthetase
MRCVTFDFLGQNKHGNLFHEYLRVRKRLFVDRLGWDIPHDDDVEMDQYDNPCAHYAVALRGASVVGGARVMPTTARWGQYSYMIRDAFLGLISIPAAIVPAEIVSDGVWECTRLVISDEISTQAERTFCLSLILCAAVDLIRERGGRELISLSPVPMARTLRQLGFLAERVGEPYSERDGRRYVVLRMPALGTAHSIAAE